MSESSEHRYTYNMRWHTEAGTECSLTIREDTLAGLIENSKAAMATLGADRKAAAPNGNGHQAGEEHYCPLHQERMSPHSKDGETWWNHKHEGKWCRGEPAASTS